MTGMMQYGIMRNPAHPEFNRGFRGFLSAKVAGVSLVATYDSDLPPGMAWGEWKEREHREFGEKALVASFPDEAAARSGLRSKIREQREAAATAG